jgi:hypothetical protein
MPRTGRRRSLTLAAAVIAVLAAPAAAQAATYTVAPGGGPCGAPDLACGSLTDAASAAAPGDVFNVTPMTTPGATYGSAHFTVGGLTITGSPTPFAVDGTLTFSGASGGVSKLQKVGISENNGAGPGIIVDGASGLELSDAAVLSVAGDAIQFHAGTANKIVRSTIGTGGSQTAAVRVLSGDTSTAPKALTMESTLLIGGLAGLSVNTGNGNGLISSPGDVTVNLRHVTAGGSTHGLVFDASMANPLIGGPFGSIVADVRDSIIMNGTVKTVYPGVLGTLTITAPPNTVTDTYTRTLQGAFDAGAVFVDPARRNFRLKAGSPAIDVGGFTPGESATDIDGQPRPGPTTDLGADEFAKVHLYKTTTKTTTVTKNGKKVKKKTTTRKPLKVVFKGTATDKSGIKGVVLTVQKLNADGTSPAATAKCKWLNGVKGIVSKSCVKPILLLAKLGTGTWTYTVKPRLGVGKYRIIVVGADNAGSFGNSATAAEAIHRFTLVK